MNNFKANIKQKYNISNYQAEQIIFVIKSLGSELSKMLIMGILFRNEILLFLFQLIFVAYNADAQGRDNGIIRHFSRGASSPCRVSKI